MKMTGAEAVIRCLLKEGVDTIFGYPGGAIMPIYDALYDFKEDVTHILTRHEQGAIHAAQGYARASGLPGVCFATSGPGATNLITGIADAQIDSTPLVCITGQVASHLLGTDAFQETDVVGISMPVTKWNFQVTSAHEIPEALAKAFYIAKSGRPGPVLIDITKDAQFETFEFDYTPCTQIRSYVAQPIIDHSAIQDAAKLIKTAKRPYLLFGQGILLSNAEKELEAFVNKAGIPSAWTIMGLSALPSNHPLNVGMLGMHGNYAPNVLTNECDVLIAVGMRFDDRVTGDLKRYATQAKVIHIDIDPAEINKNVPADVAVIGDAKLILKALTDIIEESQYPDWIAEFKRLEQIEIDKVTRKDLDTQEILPNMAEVIHRLNHESKNEALIVTDVGQHQMVACRYARFNQTRSLITSGGLGTMGFCLPAAIGAKLGCPDRTVVAVVGDGGYQMTIQELGTILQSNVDVKILLLNNEFLGMVRQWQELFFEKRYAFTEMTNPDFQTIAKGYGVESLKVNSRKELNDGLKEMYHSKGSFLLEVMVEKEANIFPMIATGASVSEVLLEPSKPAPTPVSN